MPWIMGAFFMEPMMLWMLHGPLTGQASTGGAWAAILFVAAHVVVAALLMGGALMAARLSPRARGFLSRLHLPSLRHVGTMLIAAAMSASVIHVTLHGGIV
ncbi:hypothetical protein AN189_06115 [Loktanella sp. 3ANDIMAR09]|nr:hypothetical protein AN189_06115 [Loktanella sp. 3ANDIMAR09]